MSLMAAAAATPGTAFAQPKARKSAKAAKVALYANVGEVLTRWEVDVDNATLAPRESVTLPAGVQYAWPHKSRRYLYVATSSSASGTGPTGTDHHVTAFKVDPDNGALTQHGKPIPLPVRPIHMTLDRTKGQNGEKLHLTIKVTASSPYGASLFVVTSKLGATTHEWFGLVADR